MIAERALQTGDGDAAAAAHWPAKLVVVDAERIPDRVSAARAEGGRYRALLLLVRVGGEPLGLVTVRCAGDDVARAELEPRVREVAGDRVGSEPAALLPLAPAPSASVVVSTVFERTAELRRCLESLRAVSYPRPFEILVVDNRRDDTGPSGAWVEQTPGARLLVERRPGVSAGRNRGLAEAAGEIVAFVDDDVVVDEGWLAAYARRFAAHPDEVAISGLVLPNGIETEEDARIEDYYGGYGARRFAPVSHALERPRRRDRPLRRATVVARDDGGAVVARFSLYEAGKLGVGANLAFRTAGLRALGGFDTDLGPATPTRSGEDVAILARAAWRGHAIGFEPAAFVLHTDRQGDGALKAKLEAYGTGFTAIISALVAEDPRHLGALAATLPEGAHRLAVYFAHKLRSRGDARGSGAATPAAPVSSVSALARAEIRGMIRGPLAYVRSRRGRRGRV